MKQTTLKFPVEPLNKSTKYLVYATIRYKREYYEKDDDDYGGGLSIKPPKIEYKTEDVLIGVVDRTEDVESLAMTHEVKCRYDWNVESTKLYAKSIDYYN